MIILVSMSTCIQNGVQCKAHKAVEASRVFCECWVLTLKLKGHFILLDGG